MARLVVALLSAVALAGAIGCTEQEAAGDPKRIECVGACELFTGDLAEVGTDAEGVAIVASERLGVAYEVTTRDEFGNAVPDVVIRYQETQGRESLIIIQDPSGRFGPVIVVGTPDFVASLSDFQPAVAGFGANFDGSGTVEQQLVGVGTFLVLVFGVTLTALVAKKHTDSLFQNAMEATVFFEGGVVRDNSLEMCRTPAEIASFWRNQAAMDEALDGIEFSLLIMPASAVPRMEPIMIMIDLGSLVKPDASSVTVGEEILAALNAETDANLTMTSRLHVRIGDLDTYGTQQAVLRAPLEIVSFDCDPDDFSTGDYSLSVTHAPEYPAAGQGVNVTGTLTPPEVGILVEFDARGTDEYRQLNTALSNFNGQVSFFVPGGAAGVRDEYVMTVPSLSLSAYDSLVFGATP